MSECHVVDLATPLALVGFFVTMIVLAWRL